jgi:alanyl-tRNA synthetase
MKAKQLAGSAVMIGDTRLVVHIAEGEENPEQLSKMLSEMSNVVAVIGVKEKSAKVFVSRSADVDIDCRAALKEIMKLVGGGGGGKKEYATGGGGDPEKLHDTFDKVPELLRTMCRK